MFASFLEKCQENEPLRARGPGKKTREENRKGQSNDSPEKEMNTKPTFNKSLLVNDMMPSKTITLAP